MFPVFVCCCCSVMFHVYMYYTNPLWVTLSSFVWIIMYLYYFLWWNVSLYSGISFTTHVQIWLCANCYVWSSWKLTVCWLWPQNGCWNLLLSCYKLPYWGEHEQASQLSWQQSAYVYINIFIHICCTLVPEISVLVSVVLYINGIHVRDAHLIAVPTAWKLTVKVDSEQLSSWSSEGAIHYLPWRLSMKTGR